MSKAVVMDQPGGPEVLQWRDQEPPQPEGSEVLIKQTAVGLNYIDTYHRSGLYTLPGYPAVIGLEGAGVVEALGPDCEFGFQIGQRVCYAGGPIGAYAQHRVLPERHLAGIPENIKDQHAAGIMLKGLTAHFLLMRTFFVDEQTTMLVHAAAGGVGLLLCQWGRELGARVIGTVSTPEKAELAANNGCEFPIIYTQEDFVERVREITNGVGCNVVYDSVGADTFMRSLDCLMSFGLMVSYGQSSGIPPKIGMDELQNRRSIFLTRPRLTDYIKDYEEYLLACTMLMQMVSLGKLKINIKQSYYLKDAARAHRDLESRQTTGATIFFTDV